MASPSLGVALRLVAYPPLGCTRERRLCLRCLIRVATRPPLALQRPMLLCRLLAANWDLELGMLRPQRRTLTAATPLPLKRRRSDHWRWLRRGWRLQGTFLAEKPPLREGASQRWA